MQKIKYTLTFKDFHFDPLLLDGLDSMGFDNPTPIQQQAIPIISDNKDIIACAQTGTGKTAAYLLPILNKIVKSKDRKTSTCIIAPTRELAQQIDRQVDGFAYFLGVSSIPVYGGGDGAAWNQQQKAIREGADIIIATPGRLIAMLTQLGAAKMDFVKYLILDEADRMLDMGFYDDILRIITHLPKNRQTLLFSATMPPKIRNLAQKILQNPVEINIALSRPPESILQQAYMAYDTQKVKLLKFILNMNSHSYQNDNNNNMNKEKKHDSVIIFASTKEKVKLLNKELHQSGLSIKAFHSDLEQNEREVIMQKFRNKEIQILIGTDILSRGIDVDGISLVVNFDAPPDPEDYVHRIGRTARADNTGTAITFINQHDVKKFSNIENLIGKTIPKLDLPLEFGEAPIYNPEEKPKKYFKKKPFKKKKNIG